MKYFNSGKDFDSYSPLTQHFIVFWLEETHQKVAKELSFLQWLDLALIVGDFQNDTSIELTRNTNESVFYNNLLTLEEFLLAWDGKEPIDTLSFAVSTLLTKRIIRALATQ